MVYGVVTLPGGRRVAIVGLVERNIGHLRDGKPIHRRLPPGATEIMVVVGLTEDAIRNDIQRELPDVVFMDFRL